MSLPEVSRGCRFEVVKISKEWQGVPGTSGDGHLRRWAGLVGERVLTSSRGTSRDGATSMKKWAQGAVGSGERLVGQAPPEMVRGHPFGASLAPPEMGFGRIVLVASSMWVGDDGGVTGCVGLLRILKRRRGAGVVWAIARCLWSKLVPRGCSWWSSSSPAPLLWYSLPVRVVAPWALDDGAGGGLRRASHRGVRGAGW
jgi:hypothetical protein